MSRAKTSSSYSRRAAPEEALVWEGHARRAGDIVCISRGVSSLSCGCSSVVIAKESEPQQLSSRSVMIGKKARNESLSREEDDLFIPPSGLRDQCLPGALVSQHKCWGKRRMAMCYPYTFDYASLEHGNAVFSAGTIIHPIYGETCSLGLPHYTIRYSRIPPMYSSASARKRSPPIECS